MRRFVFPELIETRFVDSQLQGGFGCEGQGRCRRLAGLQPDPPHHKARIGCSGSASATVCAIPTRSPALRRVGAKTFGALQRGVAR